jgi:hypothetical protein
MNFWGIFRYIFAVLVVMTFVAVDQGDAAPKKKKKYSSSSSSSSSLPNYKQVKKIMKYKFPKLGGKYSSSSSG